MIKVKQVIKNNVLQTTPTQLFNSYEEVVTWLNTNLVNIFSYTGSAIATTSTTDKWIIDMYCLECDTTKDCLLYLIQNDQQVKDALCANQCLPAIPFNVTNITSTDSNWWAYDCGNPILTWTASSGATSYDIFEWATLLWNTVSTTFTVTWASVWSHTYSVVAKNSWGSASWVSTTVNVVDCLTAPWNVTGTINVYDSGTATNYTCGLWFDVNFTDVATATYYQLFEWATQIGSNSATSNFVVTGQTVGSHTYTIIACNWAWCSTGTNFSVNVVACWPYTITWGGCNRFLAYGAANTFWCNIVAEALIIQESTSWVIGTKDVTIVYDFTSIDSGAYTIITLRKYDWWATELWDGTTSSWSTSSWTEFYIWNIADPAGTNYTWTVTFTNVDFSAWYNAVTVDHWVVFPWKNITYNSYTMTVS